VALYSIVLFGFRFIAPLETVALPDPYKPPKEDVFNVPLTITLPVVFDKLVVVISTVPSTLKIPPDPLLIPFADEPAIVTEAPVGMVAPALRDIDLFRIIVTVPPNMALGVAEVVPVVKDPPELLSVNWELPEMPSRNVTVPEVGDSVKFVLTTSKPLIVAEVPATVAEVFVIVKSGIVPGAAFGK